MSLVIEGPPQGVQALLLPIDPQQPAGHFDSEDEAYQAIDLEMVKLGGLHEAGIDWAYVDSACCLYLSTECKHFRVVGHLQVVWLRTCQWSHWVDALHLLAGMVERFWNCAHPKPGPTGYPNKRKQVQRWLENLEQALPNLQRSSFSEIHQASAHQALATLAQASANAKLGQEAIQTLRRQLELHGQPLPASTNEHGQSAVGGNQGPSPSTETPLPAREREQRRALLSMAEQINRQDAYDPTGYQLRRFGLWAHLSATPAATGDWRTELTVVPRDIVEAYQQALAGNALEPALLLRIERSVAASPYWLRGSYLAATVASRLAMEAVAAVIRQSCERFLSRLPALRELCFSDGTPFVDVQTLAWINGADQVASSDRTVRELSGLRDELLDQLSRDGVEAVLLRLQQLHSAYDDPRQRNYATVIAADLLASRGLSWLAENLCRNVARQMRDITAQAWEPALYRKVAALDHNRED